jgi:hypothetical protein
MGLVFKGATQGAIRAVNACHKYLDDIFAMKIIPMSRNERKKRRAFSFGTGPSAIKPVELFMCLWYVFC